MTRYQLVTLDRHGNEMTHGTKYRLASQAVTEGERRLQMSKDTFPNNPEFWITDYRIDEVEPTIYPIEVQIEGLGDGDTWCMTYFQATDRTAADQLARILADQDYYEAARVADPTNEGATS